MNPNFISHRLFVEALTHGQPSGKPSSAGPEVIINGAKKSGRKLRTEPFAARAARHLADWPLAGNWEQSVS